MLYEVRWTDSDGDRYEGIQFAKVDIGSHINVDGLFIGKRLITPSVKLACIIQTAYHPCSRNQGGLCKAVDRSSDFNSLLQEYVIRLVGENLTNLLVRLGIVCNSSNSSPLRVKEEGTFEEVGELDLCAHFCSSNPLVRFISLYYYSKEFLEGLREKVKNLSIEEVLMREREEVIKSLKFLGPKVDEIVEIASRGSTKGSDFIDNVRRLIDFYLD